MAASTANPSHRSSAALRPALAQSQLAGLSGSPHTPARNSPSSFSSPSTSLRGDDECLVFEFGARFLRAGFSGDSAPRCVVGFGPDEQRRVGDFRQWVQGYERRWRQRKGRHEWSEPHELWRLDLRGVDLGLVEDKIERAVRTAYSKYLLTDSKPRRLLLGLPPELPHGLLSALLTTLFTNLQCPSITLISAPILTTVAAGLRSALVVDIGWHETLVTGVFEFREVSHRRSVRAGRLLAEAMGQLLARNVKEVNGPGSQTGDETPQSFKNQVSFEECEDVLARMCWIWEKPARTRFNGEQTPVPGSPAASAEDRSSSRHQPDAQADDPSVSVDLFSTEPPTNIRLPFSQFAVPAERTFFPRHSSHAPGADSTVQVDTHTFDDEELPLPQLAYESLMSLPVDVRSTCLPRIIITGDGSNIPGLKMRLIAELQDIINERGWDRVRGPTSLPIRTKSDKDPTAPEGDPHTRDGASADGPEGEGEPTPQDTTFIPASEQEPIHDEITTMLESRAGDNPPPVSGPPGVARAVESLGPWAGGSLVAGLRVKGAVEIERERYISSGGLAGATLSKPGDGLHGLPGGAGLAGRSDEGKAVHKTPAKGGLAGRTPGGPGGGGGMGSGTAVSSEKGAGWSLGAWG